MPFWTLTIQGEGPHHSSDPRDADRLGAEFTASLAAQGHLIKSATIRHGDVRVRVPWIQDLRCDVT